MSKKTRGYVGAYSDFDSDTIIVWERDDNGRVAVPYHSPKYFYVPDEEGAYKSIYGTQLKKLVFDSKEEMQATARQYRKEHLHESDIPPLYKVLMDEYYEAPIPDVHYALIDIETDYSAELGFSSPENPYAPINALTTWQSWTGRYITYAVPPKGWKDERFNLRIEKLWKEHGLKGKPEITICRNEDELLKGFCTTIEDADVMSGWNSEFFDLPYIFMRMKRVNPRLVNKLCFPGCKPPKEGTVERFGSPHLIVKLNGRTHIDYLDATKKFTFEGRTSYSLASIAADELDTPKIEYDGTLEQLYKGSYRPNVQGQTPNSAVTIKADIDRLNAERELIRLELEKRGVKI